jgi:hypothetical protein
VFWRKILDIYATSVDYDARADASQSFFAVIQNKMHWAAHGQTAAEVVVRRADSTQPNMGLTTWTGSRPRRDDHPSSQARQVCPIFIHLDGRALARRGGSHHLADATSLKTIAKPHDAIRSSEIACYCNGGGPTPSQGGNYSPEIQRM